MEEGSFDEPIETLEEVSAKFEKYFSDMQKWLNTDIPNDPWAIHRAQTNMQYTLTKLGGCFRQVVAMKNT